MANTQLAWANLAPTSLITAGSSDPALPASNLTGDFGSPSLGWQTAPGVVTNAAGANFTVAFASQAMAVDAMGIFRCNLTSSASVTFSLYVNPAAPGLVYTTTLSGPVGGYGQVVAIPGATQIADYMVVSIDDPVNPDLFINVPLVYVGRAWQMIAPPAWSTTFDRDVSIDELTSIGGEEFPTLRWKRRNCQMNLQSVRASETFTQLDILDQLCRDGRNVLLVPDWTSPTLQQEAIYGRCLPSSPIGYPYQAADRRSWAARITERI